MKSMPPACPELRHPATFGSSPHSGPRCDLSGSPSWRGRRVTPVLLLAACLSAGGASAQTPAPNPTPAVLPPVPASPAPPASNLPAVPASEFLWQQVQNAQGEYLGAISDLLIDLPSGEIKFVVLEITELFGRPKVLRPDVLTVSGKPGDAVRAELSPEEWANAPRLDWNELQVTQPEPGANQIIGYHQAEWLPKVAPMPTTSRRRGENSPAPTLTPPAGAARYVSLLRLRLKRVASAAWEQDGFVNDFLVDWKTRRVTHALISPQFAPIAPPDQLWFAVPVAMLRPPEEESESLTVFGADEVIARAQRIAGDQLRADVTGVYQFPPAILSSAPARAAE